MCKLPPAYVCVQAPDQTTQAAPVPWQGAKWTRRWGRLTGLRLQWLPRWREGINGRGKGKGIEMLRCAEWEKWKKSPKIQSISNQTRMKTDVPKVGRQMSMYGWCNCKKDMLNSKRCGYNICSNEMNWWLENCRHHATGDTTTVLIIDKLSNAFGLTGENTLIVQFDPLISHACHLIRCMGHLVSVTGATPNYLGTSDILSAITALWTTTYWWEVAKW